MIRNMCAVVSDMTKFLICLVPRFSSTCSEALKSALSEADLKLTSFVGIKASQNYIKLEPIYSCSLINYINLTILFRLVNYI